MRIKAFFEVVSPSGIKGAVTAFQYVDARLFLIFSQSCHLAILNSVLLISVIPDSVIPEFVVPEFVISGWRQELTTGCRRHISGVTDTDQWSDICGMPPFTGIYGLYQKAAGLSQARRVSMLVYRTCRGLIVIVQIILLRVSMGAYRAREAIYKVVMGKCLL